MAEIVDLYGRMLTEPEHEEHHSIFVLPEHYDRRLLTWIIVALIGVTVLYERITEWLEELISGKCIAPLSKTHPSS